MNTYNIIVLISALVILGLSIWAFMTRCNTDKFGDKREPCNCDCPGWMNQVKRGDNDCVWAGDKGCDPSKCYNSNCNPECSERTDGCPQCGDNCSPDNCRCPGKDGRPREC